MNSTFNNIEMPPPQLDLSSQTNIRMPFSSPMGDEILSPTSPTAPESPVRSRRKNHCDETRQENPPSRNRRFSVQKSPKSNSAQKQGKSQNKTRWPGLNVVTNFSKPPILAQRAAEEDIRHRSGKKESSRHNTQRGRGTLSDIKTPVDSKAYEENKTHKRNRPSGKHTDRLDGNGEFRFRVECNEKKEQASAAGLGLHPFDSPPDYSSLLFVEGKSQVNSLKRSSTRITELSPSDRPIMIGITVPSAKFAELSISPDVDRPGPTTPNITDRDPPMTPTIIVTPAKDQGPWRNQNQTFQNPRRAPSSVYSQAFQHSRGVNQSTNTPPVPVPPQEHLPPNPLDHKSGKDSSARVVSSCTVFDEDDTQGRPMSGESHRRILKRSSTDSIATRHRSQGWWNHILSPFITRTNTMMFRVGTPEIGGPVPPLPTSTRGGTARKQAATNSDEISPPLVSNLEDKERDRTSVWTDFSRFEAEHRNIGLAFDHTPGSSTLVLNPTREIENTGVPDTPVPFEGSGAAAEYFHAYWHDQNSPTPYFECQNHSCLPSKTHQPIAFDLDEETSEKTLENSNVPRDASETKMQGEKSGFQQAPANRFSAAFSQAAKSNSRERALSEVTDIEDLDATPEVHEAHVAPIVRAVVPAPTGQSLPSVSPPRPHRTLVSDSSTRRLPETIGTAPSSQVSSKDFPASSAILQKPAKRFVAVMPPNESSSTREQPSAPQATLSAQAGRVPRKAVPGGRPEREKGSVRKKESVRQNETTHENDSRSPQNTYIVNHYYDNSNRRLPREEITMAEFDPPPRGERRAKHSRKRREKGEKREKDGDRKQRKCLKPRGCFKKDKPMTKRKKRLLIGVAICLIILIILILALAMTLTRKGGNKMQVQTQWLNITGFPPIPTGISTIVQPDVAQEKSGCVGPATVWSCALPKEEQQSVAPNDANQPNFRVEIRFLNGTSANSTSSATKSGKRSQILNPVSAGHFIRYKALQIRDSFTSSLISPSPAPPSQEDQAFLGNTTDHNAVPFDGETTPFFMSFLNPTKPPTSQRLLKRASGNNSDPFEDPTQAIPPPDNNPDGTAASANLLPFPSSQPLRLYNRGLPTEHYGFYTYYDRAIYLKSTSLVDDSSPSIGDVPDNRSGGSPEAAATVRCTWAQTRFLVQIWTNQGFSASLLRNSSTTTPSPSPTNLTASANDFSRPGSFPYPVTITLDRHGGDITKKFIYCYGLDQREHIVPGRKKIQIETRDFGGVLVNPAQGPFGTTKVSREEGGPGGVDGGSGGCVCQWKNFIAGK